MGAKVHRDQLINDIRNVANKLGRAPLTTEYDAFGKYSTSRARQEFGNWQHVLESCDIKPTSQNRRLHTSSELSTELDRLTNLLGHQPSWSEIKAHSPMPPDKFARRLGRSNFHNPKDLPLNPNWNIDDIVPETGGWISGFVTGEGSFAVRKDGGTILGLCQRADDKELLEIIRTVIDLPYPIHIYSNAKRRTNGQRVGDEARLHVTNRWVAKLRIIPFFERFTLHGRKAADFTLYKEAVLFLCQRDEDNRHHRRFTPDEKAYIAEISDRITALRHDPSSIS